MTTEALEVLRLAVEEAGIPTEGPLAAALWHWLSGNHGFRLPSTAAEVYRRLGYVPFAGYPLQRAR